MKRCIDIKYGGCGQTKPIESFPRSGKRNGRQEYRSRCKACTVKLDKLPKEERDKLKVPREVYSAHKTCLPVSRGGCGRTLPISEFHKHRTYRKSRCKSCTAGWLRMSLDERKQYKPEEPWHGYRILKDGCRGYRVCRGGEEVRIASTREECEKIMAGLIRDRDTERWFLSMPRVVTHDVAYHLAGRVCDA